MKKFAALLFALLLLTSSMSATSVAAPSMTPIPQSMVNPSPSPMQPIAEQLGAQLQSLVSTPAPATGEEGDQEPPPTFGTRALNVVINIAEILRAQMQRFVTDFTALPQLSDWLAQQSGDARLVARWQSIGDDLYSTAGVAFLGALALEFALYPLRRTLRRRQPRSLSTRFAIVVSLFCIRAIPIMVFASASVLLLNQQETQRLPRFLVMNVVYALALARTSVSFLRGVLSPKADGLRFVPATTEQAVYGFRWLRAWALLIIFGYFFVEVAHAVHVPDAAITAFVSVLGLIFVSMGIIAIVQKRAFVAQLLRGSLSVAHRDLSAFDMLRLWFARNWHSLAITYLVLGYVVAVTGSQNSLVVMLRGTLLTLLVLVAARLLLREIGFWEMRKKGTTTLYNLVKGLCLRFAIVAAAIAAILAAWGADLVSIASAPLGQHLLGAAFSVGVTSFILGLIYEFFSAAVDHHLTPRSLESGEVIEVNARSRTLLPMIRNVIFVVFLAAVGVVVLSEAGINIAPLLAGAGVLGVAVGFGSQTLVKDFLTGLFIVLENSISVGDVIKSGDHSGVVEAMSMRTIRLRDNDGNLHIMPFSEVTGLVNQTKEFSYAVLKVNVATDTDLERAIECIREACEDVRADPVFQRSILDAPEILGVDSINDTSITLVSRVRTEAGKQWSVKRMLLLRLKMRFDKAGVQLPSVTSIKLEKGSTLFESREA